MKSTYMFRDQVNMVTSWFSGWNQCEQTVALYALLKKVSGTQARFLQQVLGQSVSDCADIHQQEIEANDPGYVAGLCNLPKEGAVNQLLSHLPLLRAGNMEAKEEYLRVIPRILEHSIKNSIHIEESRQLLSFSLIHPALNNQERSALHQWLSQLEESYQQSLHNGRWPYHLGSQYAENGFNPSQTGSLATADLSSNSSSGGVAGPLFTGATGQSSRLNGWWDANTVTGDTADSAHYVSVNGTPESDAGSCTNGRHVSLHTTYSAPSNFTSQISNSQRSSPPPVGHQKLRRSISVTPPVNVPGMVDNKSDPTEPSGRSSRSHSLQYEHGQLSPQSSVASSGSGSDSHQEEPQVIKNSFAMPGSGMKDVPVWLKCLRLHKYASMFQHMTYEEMLNLTEEGLEKQNVTKGARHKIILNIAKLKERYTTLKELEKDVMEGTQLKAALVELMNIIQTPIKSFTPPDGALGEACTAALSPTDQDRIDERDLPGQFTKVLGKVCTQLLVSSRPDFECVNMYLQLLDKCIYHEAFSEKGKKLILSWKQQIQKLWQRIPPKFAQDPKKKSWVNTFPQVATAGLSQPRAARQPQCAGQLQWTFGCKKPLSCSNSFGAVIPGSSATLPRGLSGFGATSRPNTLELPLKSPVQRTHSAPNKSSSHGFSLTNRPASDLSATEPEINARLDSLCLSMTEAALDSMDSPDKGPSF